MSVSVCIRMFMDVLLYCRALMSQQQHVRVQKQVRVIENRLDKSYVRFNSILTENTKLRDLIDHLRRERGVFEGLSKRLEKVTYLRT